MDAAAIFRQQLLLRPFSVFAIAISGVEFLQPLLITLTVTVGCYMPAIFRRFDL